MRWQDTLRELDAKFAAGALSADQHRRMRDEVLAEASGTVSLSAAPPLAVSEPPLAVSEPPRPPVAPPPQPERMDVPRFSPSLSESIDGRSLFANTASKRSRLTPLLVIIGLAVAAGGVWFYLTWPPRADEVNSPPPRVEQSATLANRLPKLPGTVIVAPAMLPAAVGIQFGLYPPAVAQGVGGSSAGLANVAATDGPTTITANLLDNAAGPDRTAEVVAHATAGGWELAKAPDFEARVSVVQSVSGQFQLYRAVYKSDRSTVIITIAGPRSDQARPAFDAIVERALADLPAR